MYAKIFEQIFDSSIADDYELRHFFMDLLVLADCNGVVDRTPTAIAARTRIPLSKVTKFIARLESPDMQSRTLGWEGRRIAKFDEHRDWGWVILNFERFKQLASDRERRETTRIRSQRFKDKTAQVHVNHASDERNLETRGRLVYEDVVSDVSGKGKEGDARGRFCKPDFESVKLHGIKIGLPESECEKFWNYYESNGWRVGKNPMRLWTAAMANWKRHWIEYTGGVNGVNKSNGSNGAKTQSVFELREIIKAKESQAVELRLKHCSEVAMGDQWNNGQARQKYFTLKNEIKDINKRIANAYS